MQDKLADPAFLAFLDACVIKANTATDHFDAKVKSDELDELATAAIVDLKRVMIAQPVLVEEGLAVEMLVVPDGLPINDDLYELDDVDPEGVHELELAEERAKIVSELEDRPISEVAQAKEVVVDNVIKAQ